MSDCVFCKILARKLPASFVAEDHTVAAFMDLRQPVPGHVLVIPRRHAPTIYDLTPEEGGAAMNLAIRVARSLRKVFAPAQLRQYVA